jgi:hypothetical protein
MLARPPLDVSVRPVPAVAAAAGGRAAPPPRRQLYEDWRFWAIVGSAFAAMVTATYLVTRPDPQPYTGNAAPFYVSFQ